MYLFWFSRNIILKLGQILTKNSDVSKKPPDFTKKKKLLELHIKSYFHAKIQVSSTFLSNITWGKLKIFKN